MQEVQNRLLDAQRAGDKRFATANVNQLPTAQRRVRQQCAPARLRQCLDSETKRRPPQSLVVMACHAQSRHSRIKFGCHAEEKDIALEGRKMECAAKTLQERPPS